MDTLIEQMEEAKRSNLVVLPSDFLAGILILLNGFHLSKLWLCGDKALCHRLQKEVKHFELVYKPQTLPNWPLLISCFSSLESLKIVRSSPVSKAEYLPLFGVDPSTIPASLRSIETKFLNDSILYASFQAGRGSRLTFRQISRCYPNLKSIQAVCSIDISQHALNCAAKTLDGLVRLQLEHSTFQLTTQDIPSLPSSLEVLTVSMATNQLWDRPSLKFPQSLTKLSLFKLQSSLCITTIPANLTNLKLSYNRSGIQDKKAMWNQLKCPLIRLSVIFGPMPTVDDFKALPPTLKTFLLYCADEPEPETLAHLPPGLTDLKFPMPPLAEYASLLPPGLTNCPEFVNAPVECWPYLQNLQRMDLWEGFPDVSQFSELPSSLTTLRTSNVPNSFEVLNLPNLRDLTLFHYSVEKPGVFSPHFANLTHLSLSQIDSLSFDAFDDAPFQLIHLAISGMYDYGLALDKMDLLKPWSKRLECLYLTYSTVPSSSPLQLPPSLKVVEIEPCSSSTQCIDVGTMWQLPRNLTSLQLCLAPFDASHIQKLPRRLHTLRLVGNRSSDKSSCTLQDSDLLMLPRSLTVVRLPNSPNFSKPISTLSHFLPSADTLEIPTFAGYRSFDHRKLLSQFDSPALIEPLSWRCLNRLSNYKGR